MNWTSVANEVMLNPRWPEPDLLFLREQAEKCLSAEGLVSHVVVTSSGATAESWRAIKLVFLAKSALLAAAQVVVDEYDLKATDIFAQSLPEFHVGGLGIQARAYLCQSQVALLPPWKSAISFNEDLIHSKATVLSLVPTQVHDLVVAGVPSPKFVRYVFVGAGALPITLEKAARDLGWPLVATFGMTETGAMIAGRSTLQETVRPFRGVVGELNSEGLLRVRCPGLATGILQWKQGRAEWTPLSGSYQTQDRIRIGPEGWVIEGRDRDFIKINGESVSLEALREILSEELLRAGQSPFDFHLLALPHERSGFQLGLVVQGKRHDSSRSILDDYNRRVLPFERIRVTFFVERIPRTELGKVREDELKKELTEEL